MAGRRVNLLCTRRRRVECCLVSVLVCVLSFRCWLLRRVWRWERIGPRGELRPAAAQPKESASAGPRDARTKRTANTHQRTTTHAHKDNNTNRQTTHWLQHAHHTPAPMAQDRAKERPPE